VTESAWLSSTDTQAMLAFLRRRGPVSDRKLRLYACACCLSVWHLLADERSREAVRVSERFADGLASDGDRAAASWAAEAVVLALNWRHRLEGRLVGEVWVTVADSTSNPPTVDDDARRATRSSQWATYGGAQYVGLGNQLVQNPHLLRDIFGDPFRPVLIDPSWRTEAVVALARGIYEERAFERLPVLADALEDAGCDSADVLEHCRGPNAHVRGCWLVDVLLGHA
jgi:hypothetical protein